MLASSALENRKQCTFSITTLIGNQKHVLEIQDFQELTLASNERGFRVAIMLTFKSTVH